MPIEYQRYGGLRNSLLGESVQHIFLVLWSQLKDRLTVYEFRSKEPCGFESRQDRHLKFQQQTKKIIR